MAATGWIWSAQFGDLDNDGDLDLYAVNGMVGDPPATGPVDSPDIRPRFPGPGLTTRAVRPASTLDPGTGAA